MSLYKLYSKVFGPAFFFSSVAITYRHIMFSGNVIGVTSVGVFHNTKRSSLFSKTFPKQILEVKSYLKNLTSICSSVTDEEARANTPIAVQMWGPFKEMGSLSAFFAS